MRSVCRWRNTKVNCSAYLFGTPPTRRNPAAGTGTAGQGLVAPSLSGSWSGRGCLEASSCWWAGLRANMSSSVADSWSLAVRPLLEDSCWRLEQLEDSSWQGPGCTRFDTRLETVRERSGTLSMGRSVPGMARTDVGPTRTAVLPWLARRSAVLWPADKSLKVQRIAAV